jgi:hypothetical protein
MEVLCDSKGTNVCPSGGVGVYNPGYWGMVWYSFISLYVYVYNMPKYFLTNITCSSYNIAELICQFRIGLKCIILLNEMELLKVYLVLLFVVQNIERRKSYKVSLHIRSSDAVSLSVSLRSSDGLQKLACHTIT